jgi:hypothetical protein
MEELSSNETSVLTRATGHNIPEDVILHSHRRENLKLKLLDPINPLLLSVMWNDLVWTRFRLLQTLSFTWSWSLVADCELYLILIACCRLWALPDFDSLSYAFRHRIVESGLQNRRLTDHYEYWQPHGGWPYSTGSPHWEQQVHPTGTTALSSSTSWVLVV